MLLKDEPEGPADLVTPMVFSKLAQLYVLVHATVFYHLARTSPACQCDSVVENKEVSSVVCPRDGNSSLKWEWFVHFFLLLSLAFVEEYLPTSTSSKASKP